MVNVVHVKKGDVLVKEGDVSNSMYWIQNGTLRLYKKKGQGYIELGVVHSGEVVGEMSFLDNQPRSAFVEALQPCDIIEIPRGKFEEYLNAQPSWLKSLVNTLVKRLRQTTNRVRELESASMVYAKNDDGKSEKVHEFLSALEVLKLSSALLLVAARNGEKLEDGSIKVKAAWLQLYGAQIFSVHLSKIQVFIDTLQDDKVIRIDKQKDHVDLYVFNPDFLEKFIFWFTDENSKPDEKQLPMTGKGMQIVHAIHEFGDLDQAPPDAELIPLNIDTILQKAASARQEKMPFDISHFEDLVKSGLAKEIRVDSTGKNTELLFKRFQKIYPFLSLRYRFRSVNANKRP